jgi:hypothetical protein
MDMDRLVRRVSEQLAARPSRRGFVATVAAGAGAILAGLRGSGVAAESPYTYEETCCTGSPCDKPNRCPPRASKKGWSWYCTVKEGRPNAGNTYLCQDCYNGNDFVCNTAKRV